MDVVDISDTAAVAGTVGVASVEFFIDRDKVPVNGSGSSSSSSSSGTASNGDSTGDRHSTPTGGGSDDDIMCVVGTGINVNDTIGVSEWPWMRVLDALRVHHGIRCRSLS